MLPQVCSLIILIHSSCYTSLGVPASEITANKTRGDNEHRRYAFPLCLIVSLTLSLFAVFTLNQPDMVVHNSASGTAGLIDHWRTLYDINHGNAGLKCHGIPRALKANSLHCSQEK